MQAGWPPIDRQGRRAWLMPRAPSASSSGSGGGIAGAGAAFRAFFLAAAASATAVYVSSISLSRNALRTCARPQHSRTVGLSNPEQIQASARQPHNEKAEMHD